MWKSVIGLVLLTLAVVSAPAHSKSIVYNGIECAAPTAGNWVPTTAGLYGLASGVTYCPIVQQSSEGYTYAQLSYVMLYGINLTNPRLCRRDSNGAVTCGSSAALGSDAWILYTPGGGSSYDDAFLSINVGTGVSLVKRYAVAWIN